jgi:hypothetical protein
MLLRIFILLALSMPLQLGEQRTPYAASLFHTAVYEVATCNDQRYNDFSAVRRTMLLMINTLSSTLFVCSEDSSLQL